MWTAATRAQHSRDELRFASDLTDAGWAIVAPLLPAGSLVGRPPSWPRREIVNAIFYVLRGGVPWRKLPPGFPPRQTVYAWFAAWRDAGIWQPKRRGGRQSEREDDRSGRPTRLRRRQEDQGPQAARDGRHGQPRPRAAEPSCRRAGSRRGHPAAEGVEAPLPVCEARLRRHSLAAERVAAATSIAIEVVRKIPGQVGFEVHPRRWVVERCFAWLNRNRRLAKDFEATIASATAFLYAASAMLLIRRLARST